MRCLPLWCCFVAATLLIARGAEPTDPQEAPLPKESVRFDGDTLHLAWQGENPGEKIKEYIPAGQDLESWTKLASIREYPQLNDVQALVGSFVRTLDEKNPEIPKELHENRKKNEVVLEFIIWPSDGPMKNAKFVEYNIFKYSLGEERGVVAQQYALRAYDDIDGFLRQLRPVKQRVLQEMEATGLKLETDPASSETATKADSEDDGDASDAKPNKAQADDDDALPEGTSST